MKIIVHPVLEAHGNMKNLLLVLDGRMSKLPLESLLIQSNNNEKHKYLIEDHEVAYFYSIRQIFESDNSPIKRKLKILGLAPKFTGPSINSTPPSNNHFLLISNNALAAF